jgi:hypothetical protein
LDIGDRVRVQPNSPTAPPEHHGKRGMITFAGFPDMSPTGEAIDAESPTCSVRFDDEPQDIDDALESWFVPE